MEILDSFAAALNPAGAETLSHVRDYVEWQAQHRQGEFEPGDDDDVDLRTYLMHLRAQGADADVLGQRTAALRAFYAWAQSEGLLADSPFDQFNFDRPFLSRDQIRRRASALDADPQQREVRRLRALNTLFKQLNRSVDVQTALDATLTTLVDILDLRTAWAYVTTASGLLSAARAEQPPHGFVMASACGLPRGLAREEGRYLRQPPICHCQWLLRQGQLARAVNVVECTRLQKSAAAAGDNEGLLFHASTPVSVRGAVAGIINVATAEWQLLTAADLQFLSAVGAQISAALERAQLFDEMNAHRVRLAQELDMARQVQASLLPQTLPDIPGFSLAADWQAAFEVAGDFYDIFEMPGGRWGLVIGDVSNKGAAAAMYMAMVRSLIRSAAAHASNPAQVLQNVNRSLHNQSAASEMFVTVFFAVLDPAARTLAYANAGHNPPLVRRATGPPQRLTRTGPLLGVLERVDLAGDSVRLEAGDGVVFYTDGLTDALNADTEEYGLERLEAQLARAPAAAAACVRALLADLRGFCGATPQADDLTLVVLTCG